MGSDKAQCPLRTYRQLTVEAIRNDEKAPGVYGEARCKPEPRIEFRDTNREPLEMVRSGEHDLGRSDRRDGRSNHARGMVRGFPGWRLAITEIPRGESKKRDRSGCSSLNRLPAFVPTREFLAIIAE